MDNKRIDSYKKSFIFNLFFIPLLLSFFVIILNNYEKFNSLFKTLVIVLLTTSSVLLIISLCMLIKNGLIFNRKKIYKKVFLLGVFGLYVFEIITLVNLVYYDSGFKKWLITSSSSSIKYQDLANKFYSKYTIDEVIGEDIELEEELIDFNVDYDYKLYDNKYEKEILDREEGALYKIIKISGTTSGHGAKYVGYLAVIYDPSHVKLAKSSGAGTFEGSYGETLATIARKNDAIVAINAGGFYDPNWNSNGGIPHGDVFIDGELDSTYRSAKLGGIIGFTKDNKLVLKNMTTEEAMEMGIRDAVDWGPFLIVDGVNKYPYDTYWECGRTAIGQRKDGIVLLLVIDGLQEHSKGASYKDLADIMSRYGAVNAANLDGGTSTSMVENGEYVNSPWNGQKPTFRRFPNAWIVVE